MAKIADQTGTAEVMTCPACHNKIRANLVVSVTPGNPELGADGKVTLPVTTKLTRFHVAHQCMGPIEVADEEPTS